uniref:p7K n=1 Tax=Comamonas testosteroni TaxID=285 RepID=Q5XPL3_COMTE|nr:P7K [Comamonas testosteroni]
MALCLTSLGSPRRLPWWSACTRPVSFSGKTGPRPSPPKSTLPRLCPAKASTTPTTGNGCRRWKSWWRRWGL